MRSSGISRAKPSIIRIDSLLPETIRSRSLSSRASCVGKGTNSPSIEPSRTEPIGPWNGSGEMHSAAEAPFIASTSPSFCRSLASTKAWTWTSSLEPVGEQRADGAVHQPGGEGFLGGRPAFAFEEAAGELARRRHALAIIAGQREEIAGPRAARGRGRQHDRFAVLHKTTAGGLLGQFAGFDGKNGCSDLTFNTYFQCSFLPSS